MLSSTAVNTSRPEREGIRAFLIVALDTDPAGEPVAWVAYDQIDRILSREACELHLRSGGRVAACLRRWDPVADQGHQLRRSQAVTGQARPVSAHWPHARTPSPVLVAGVLKRGLYT